MTQRSSILVLMLCGMTAATSAGGCASDALEAGSQPRPEGSLTEKDSGSSDTGDGDGDEFGDGDGSDFGDGDGDGDGDAPHPMADAGPAKPVWRPKCMHKDSQLIVIGDSYINWISHTFPDDIKRESGQSWRMQAIGGMSMATGGAGYPLGIFIPNQFDDAIKADPDAHTVLMDGGGNDVLVGLIQDGEIEKCKDTGSSQLPVCQMVVDRALAAAEALMVRAIDAGVRDVVYFFYPHIPEGRDIGGPHPNEMLNYALPRVKDFCDTRIEASGGALRCSFIDMVPVFEGHNPEWFNGDIHPNSDGSKAMAKEVWTRMKALCIGQKEDSGCCEP